MKHEREPAYGSDPAEQTDPIFVEIGMDVRIHIRMDLRKFLRGRHVDSESGEPTPEQLQVHFIEGLVLILLGQEYVVDADMRFIDDDAILQ